MENYMWIQHDSTDFCYSCYFPTKSVESVLIPHLLFFCALVAEILTFRCSNSKCGWMKSVDEKSQDLSGKIPSIFCVMLSFTGEFPSFHGWVAQKSVAVALLGSGRSPCRSREVPGCRKRSGTSGDSWRFQGLGQLMEGTPANMGNFTKGKNNELVNQEDWTTSSPLTCSRKLGWCLRKQKNSSPV